MNWRVLGITLFFLIAVSLHVSIMAYAPDNGTEINLTSFPSELAAHLSVDEFGGQLIASLIFCLMFILPTAIWTKTLIPPLIMGILSLCACVAFQWLDVWVLMVIALLCALLFGTKMSTIITGGGEKG